MTQAVRQLLLVASEFLPSGLGPCDRCGSTSGTDFAKHYSNCLYRELAAAMDAVENEHPMPSPPNIPD